MSTPTPFRAFSVANLASPAILSEHREPWYTASAIPSFKDDRDGYKRWMSEPTSVVPLFSLIEGENPGQRVSTANEAHLVYGIITDYDVEAEDSEIPLGLARIPARFPCFAWNRTRRGGIRMIWRFEKPIFYYGDDTYSAFLKRVKRELNLSVIFPGLDEKAFFQVDQVYVAGDKWTVNKDAFIGNETLNMWLFDVLKKSKDFDKEMEIPLDLVAAEVERQFPGRWSGKFEEGARGVRFWDMTADNPTAALVRKTGMTAFTGDRGFLPWAEILGRAFTSKYQEDRVGKAVAEMYCDEAKNYYRELPDGSWDLCEATHARRHLKIDYLLSDVARKGDIASEIDQVLHHLEMHRRIVGAIPFTHRPEQVVTWEGKRYLNSAQCELVRPCAEKVDPMFGKDFPFIADYMVNLWIDATTLEVVLAWLKIYYQLCHEGKPDRGHALFISGPPGTGKTFFSRVILGTIFGGCADARSYFVEGSRFNSSMFDHSVWSLDDSTILGDRKAYQKFSGLIKACVANPSMPYEKKFGYSGSCSFTGRFVCTLNDDPVSLGILPDTDQSLLDKVILVRTGTKVASLAGSVSANQAAVDAELPRFLRWLLDWELPDTIERDDRFGMKSFHDSTLLLEARSSSDSNGTLELLEMWIEQFEAPKPGEPWRGNTTKLLQCLKNNTTTERLASGYTLRSFGIALKSMIRANDCEWIKPGRDAKMNHIYVIHKPSLILKKAA